MIKASMKQLDPKAVWLFFLSSMIGIFFLLLPFTLVFGFTLSNFISELQQEFAVPSPILFFLEYWWLLPLLWIAVAYIWAHLSYRFYKYELREDGFRKELGVIWKQYVTIPYDRIQNVDIYRGLLARLLGLSDLQIQTAGMSASYGGRYAGMGSEGRLPGLSREEAEKVRDELIKRAKGASKQGL